ncbi:flagellar biosynthetic protein FliO [Clostridium oceanicum]|uniref:Flagellar protein n=1 Tax=Clostridium oceanicum TaxID=1543 RepID=A0ABP3V2A5_9CLOT
MDFEILWMFLKIVIFIPFIVILIYLSLKYGGGKLQKFQNGKYIKILERVPISKENSIILAKIGDKGYVMSSTHGRMEIMTELTEKEVLDIEKAKQESIPQYDSLKDFCMKNNLNGLYKKLSFKKEDKRYEKKQ